MLTSLFRALFLILLSLAPLADATAENVLYITSNRPFGPWESEIQSSFAEALRESKERPVIYREELFRLNGSNADPDLVAEVIAELDHKYANTNLDRVVLTGVDALNLFRSEAERLFPNIPRIAITDSESIAIDIEGAVTTLTLSTLYGIDLTTMYAVIPNLSEIILVSSLSDNDQWLEAIAEQAPEVSIRVLDSKYTAQEVLQTVREAPDTTGIHYTVFALDRNGERYVPARFVSELAAVSNQPIFASFKTMIGKGAFGGLIADPEKLGKLLAKATTDKDFVETVRLEDLYTYTYDANELERWGIDPSALPLNARLVNQKPNTFEKEDVFAVGAGVTVLFGTLLALITIRSYRRLQEANQKLNDRNTELETLNLLIMEQSHVDSLTGLLNRDGLYHQLKLKQERYASSSGALYMLDIDYFKTVNDTYGHLAGDLLLSNIGTALSGIQELKGSIIARLGGEEFLVVATNTDHQQVNRIAELIRRRIECLSVSYEGQNISRTASVGVAFITSGDLFSEILSHADLALEHAKAMGRNTVVSATDSFLEEQKAQRYFDDIDVLEAALRDKEFVYFAQPITDSQTGQVQGYEALIRWVDKAEQVRTPEYFLPLLMPLFFKPMYKAIRASMCRELVKNLEGSRCKYIAWNFNLEQFESNEFVDDMINGHEPPFLNASHETVLEISEAQMHGRRNMDAIVENLGRLRSAGYKIALDDFGVDHSNLHRLVTLPIDIVKLDRSLVANVVADRRVQSTIRFVSLLAKSLGLRVVAEGMEDSATVRLLSAAKITLQQGYYFSKPLPQEELKVFGFEQSNAIPIPHIEQ